MRCILLLADYGYRYKSKINEEKIRKELKLTHATDSTKSDMQ